MKMMLMTILPRSAHLMPPCLRNALSATHYPQRITVHGDERGHG